MILEHLEPHLVWSIFENILATTPRSSKHETKIRSKIIDWIKQEAQTNKNNISVNQDLTGNILIKKYPINQNFDAKLHPPLLLQVHMDMVCETDLASGYDFENNGIQLRIQDNKEWVDAIDTTLGADDGIGVALALALIPDSDLFEYPFEILITVDEETGLTGALNLDLDALKIESKHMINVDSEDLGKITIGSAGGGDLIFKKEFRLHQNLTSDQENGLIGLELQVSGLLGGHSGVDIHLNRANAHKILARIMQSLSKDIQILLNSWEGGSKHNTIPRNSFTRFLIQESDLQQFKILIEKEIKHISDYYCVNSTGKNFEPNMQIKYQTIDIKNHYSEEDTVEIITLLSNIPDGPIRYSSEIENLVETSNNLAIINTSEDLFTNTFQMDIILSVRSSINAELNLIRNNLANFGKLLNWKVELTESYPGWKPDPDSKFLKFIIQHYEECLKDAVQVEAIHAGLETGIIGDKFPNMQMVSIGPTIKFPHSPDERLKIADVAVIFELLKAIIKNFPIFYKQLERK
jgi:dipeptidase D